jgi:gallate dioxygenase
MESAEIIMWLIMRGSLPRRIDCVHRDYCLPSMTAIATVIYENPAETADREAEEQRRRIGRQLTGIENLQGTYPFTLETSHRAYRLNDFLHRLVEPAHRERFLHDTANLYEEFRLTSDERRLVDDRDWIGLIHYGVIFFCLEKMAAVIGSSNPEVYAQMRGETLEEFQKTRNVSMQYSVAGGDAARKLAKKGEADR